DAARADLITSEKTREQARVHYERLEKLIKQAAISVEELNGAKLTLDRFTEEVKSRKANVDVARHELEPATILLEMQESRRPVRGVIQSILKKGGEAASELETVIRIKVEEK